MQDHPFLRTGLLLFTAVPVAMLVVLSEDIGWYCLPLGLAYGVALLPLWPAVHGHRSGDEE